MSRMKNSVCMEKTQRFAALAYVHFFNLIKSNAYIHFAVFCFSFKRVKRKVSAHALAFESPAACKNPNNITEQIILFLLP